MYPTIDDIALDTRARIAKGFKAIHQQELNDLQWVAIVQLCMKVDMDPLIHTYEELYPVLMQEMRRSHVAPNQY